MSLFSPSTSTPVTNSQTTNNILTDNRSISDSRNYSTVTQLGSGNNGSTVQMSDIGNTESNSRNVTTTTTTNNIQTTDAGAIAAGQNIAQSSLDLAKVLFSKSQQTLDANVQLAGELASGANQAYSDATAQATGNKSLILVAIAVVGLVAVVFLKKH